MSGSVATRLQEPGFWNSLDKLKNIYNIQDNLLTCFMSGSVAVRINNPQLYKELDKIKDNINEKKLRKLKREITKIIKL